MSSSGNTIIDSDVITIENGLLKVPDKPIIPFIEGDGIGADVWRASRRVLDAAIEKAYDNQRSINWVEALAGEKAFNKTGEWLPPQTLEMWPESELKRPTTPSRLSNTNKILVKSNRYYAQATPTSEVAVIILI